MIVGFGPGSTADILARLVAAHMATQLGAAVVVENRPGNSSMLAAEAVARAPKDGQTLFMGTVANVLNPLRMRSPFDLVKDMEPVALLGVSPNVLVVHPSVPARTVQELMALARAKPDTLIFGTSGIGTASDLAAQLFNTRAGTKIVTVQYQGGASQGVTDLITGRITAMFNVAVVLAPYANAGRLVPLAVGQPRRTEVMPTVPTMDEQGVPGFDVGVWVGLLAPAGTAPAVVERLSRLANEALQTEAVKTAMATQGMDAVGAGPAEFRAFIASDTEKWRSIIEAADQR
ncbi:Bug family tripartite tricarboxylate transporter substrate binding protein [Phreatobacter sp. AB_2022a]|uniref:Bug family tripartite tricarboxylate transporter substrate binding protein n=1 Tax=Phreatobacter sp. AB_2022a TaxID=3003134 RepID=UPI002286F20D|nr:tripartite tricarboxylate transporter substrate-binding protein [Phreatobacter sp. AB_2022a]MCZ0736878.1 tripartite tricarboxylate transporter substrate-binding protein [Phreatobacter sp. AB_2022a]